MATEIKTIGTVFTVDDIKRRIPDGRSQMIAELIIDRFRLMPLTAFSKLDQAYSMVGRFCEYVAAIDSYIHNHGYEEGEANYRFVLVAKPLPNGGCIFATEHPDFQFGDVQIEARIQEQTARLVAHYQITPKAIRLCDKLGIQTVDFIKRLLFPDDQITRNLMILEAPIGAAEIQRSSSDGFFFCKVFKNRDGEELILWREERLAAILEGFNACEFNEYFAISHCCMSGPTWSKRWNWNADVKEWILDTTF